MTEFYLSELSERDKPWDKHRAETDLVSALYNQVGYSRLVERLDSCSQLLLFAIANPEHRFILEAGSFCRVRQCPTCQWRRQLMWKARFIQALPAIQVAFPKGRWLLLTLTVKNCPVTELRQTITHMNQSFQRLSQRKTWPAIGFIKSVEVTRNPKDGTAHPHFHVLVLVNPGYFKGGAYIKHEKWQQLWGECLRVSYIPIVNVKAVKDLDGAVLEVLKYQVKPADLVADAQWLAELTKQLHKTRAVSVGGVLSDYLKDDEPTDNELIHGDDEPSEITEDDHRYIAQWNREAKRYKGSFRET